LFAVITTLLKFEEKYHVRCSCIFDIGSHSQAIQLSQKCLSIPPNTKNEAKWGQSAENECFM